MHYYCYHDETEIKNKYRNYHGDDRVNLRINSCSFECSLQTEVVIKITAPCARPPRENKQYQDQVV